MFCNSYKSNLWILYTLIYLFIYLNRLKFFLTIFDIFTEFFHNVFSGSGLIPSSNSTYQNLQDTIFYFAWRFVLFVHSKYVWTFFLLCKNFSQYMNKFCYSYKRSLQLLKIKRSPQNFIACNIFKRSLYSRLTRCLLK